jgi:hypothetical protein
MVSPYGVAQMRTISDTCRIEQLSTLITDGFRSIIIGDNHKSAHQRLVATADFESGK